MVILLDAITKYNADVQFTKNTKGTPFIDVAYIKDGEVETLTFRNTWEALTDFYRVHHLDISTIRVVDAGF